MENRWENSGTSERLYFFGSKITADGDCSHETKKKLSPWKKSYGQPRQHITKQRHYFANKGPSSQDYILSPCLFNLYAEYVMRNSGLDEAQAGIKISGRNIKTSDMQMTPHLWQNMKKN